MWDNEYSPTCGIRSSRVTAAPSAQLSPWVEPSRLAYAETKSHRLDSWTCSYAQLRATLAAKRSWNRYYFGFFRLKKKTLLTNQFGVFETKRWFLILIKANFDEHRRRRRHRHWMTMSGVPEWLYRLLPAQRPYLWTSFEVGGRN